MKFFERFSKRSRLNYENENKNKNKKRNSVVEDKLIKNANTTATYARLRDLIVEEALGNLPKDVSAVLGYDFISPFHDALIQMRKKGISFCAFINEELIFDEKIEVKENSKFKNTNDYSQRFTFTLENEVIEYENIIVFGDLLNQSKAKFTITKSQEESILNYENALLKFYRKLNDGHAWVYKINDYANSRLSKNMHDIDTHNRTQELANRTSSSIVILDAEDDFINTQLDLNWFPDFIHEYKAKICSDFGQIYTKFFGEGATGLQATGQGDRKSWYDQVRAFQIINIHKQLKKYSKLLNKEQEYEKIVYEELDATDRQANALIDTQRITQITTAVSMGLLDYELGAKLIREVLGITEKENKEQQQLDIQKYIGVESYGSKQQF